MFPIMSSLSKRALVALVAGSLALVVAGCDTGHHPHSIAELKSTAVAHKHHTPPSHTHHTPPSPTDNTTADVKACRTVEQAMKPWLADPTSADLIGAAVELLDTAGAHADWPLNGDVNLLDGEFVIAELPSTVGLPVDSDEVGAINKAAADVARDCARYHVTVEYGSS